MACMLNSFPWEVLHTIFDYLNTTDLLHAFVDINPYLDRILHSYSRIQLNFKSMKKASFYYICEHIDPEQVQSLVLSNNEYTPGQIQLFMSLLPLIKFVNLQYLNIDQIDDVNLLYKMLSHLENHVQIRSLSITGPYISLSKKNARSITEILTTLSSLKYLTFINSSTLLTLRQPLLKLIHLTICSCNFNDLQIIFHWIPNLRYLHVSVPFNNHLSTLNYVPQHLNSLIIESKSWALFDGFEKFFSLTPLLTRLILETVGEQALLNGRRWEVLIRTKLPHLKELALNITPEENNMTSDDVLLPFQSSFWTTEKHWYMACMISTMTETCARLFSVPHFAPTDDWYPPCEGFINKSLNPYSFYDNCTELRIVDFPSQLLIPSRLEHIQTLSLGCSMNNIDELQKLINLSSVIHLKIQCSVQCTVIDDLLQAAPNINQLTIMRKILIQFIDSFPDKQNVYEQIKMLHVTDTIFNNDIDQICQTFPKLEHVFLFVKEHKDFYGIFSGLHYLTSATIHWNHSFKEFSTIIDEYLQQNNICTDGTYYSYKFSLNVWID